MKIGSDLRVSTSFASYPKHPPRHSPINSKVGFYDFQTRRSGISETNHLRRSFRITGENKLSREPVIQEVENLLFKAINMSFSDRLNLAWKVLFPPLTASKKMKSNANIAKQRLKMILFSDRCAVSEEAKEKIISNVICVLSDFVIIDSQDKVQLSVSTDPDHGTICSVIVPVRRVRPEYQEKDEAGMITNVEYKDTGESSGCVDVTFDFFIPD